MYVQKKMLKRNKSRYKNKNNKIKLPIRANERQTVHTKITEPEPEQQHLLQQ